MSSALWNICSVDDKKEPAVQMDVPGGRTSKYQELAVGKSSASISWAAILHISRGHHPPCSLLNAPSGVPQCTTCSSAHGNLCSRNRKVRMHRSLQGGRELAQTDYYKGEESGITWDGTVWRGPDPIRPHRPWWWAWILFWDEKEHR